MKMFFLFVSILVFSFSYSQRIGLGAIDAAGNKYKSIIIGNQEWFEDNLIDLGYEFKDINPEILSDLQKLLNLAKTNKPLFDMLIKQLRSM